MLSDANVTTVAECSRTCTYSVVVVMATAGVTESEKLVPVPQVKRKIGMRTSQEGTSV